MKNKPKALYLHVPFCKHICYYCDFCHQIYLEQLADRWLDAVKQEIEAREINNSLETVYVGGGTPTSLSEKQLDQLLSYLDPYCKDLKEFTVEINPETFTREKANILKKHYVNRVSIGFQTSSESLLKVIGRNHTMSELETTVNLLRENGINNISLDLMYSLPGQTMQDLQNSVYDALALKPNHLSLYSLTIEENTVFGKKGIESLDEEVEADMYDWICKTLPKYGFEHYEISNFCKLGNESLHNKTYWYYNDFYGISCGASGKENHERYDKPDTIAEYLKDPLAKTTIVLSKRDEMFEFIMMGLRLKEGIQKDIFQKRFGIDIKQIYNEPIHKNIQREFLEEDTNCIRCTEKGFSLLNSVLLDFMEDS